MVALKQFSSSDSGAESIPPSAGCGTNCGAGLEKVFPATAVRYGVMGVIGEFKYKPGTVFRCGAKVVIQTERGIELGQQVSVSCSGCDKHVSREQIKQYINNSGPEFYRLGSGRILREADEQDTNEHTRLNAHVDEDVRHCRRTARSLNLAMKVVTAEHLLGGERIVFYFRSESRVDFRELVRELAERYQTRIEMRQVGARDEARLVADYEICGRECCCKNFLKKLRPVSMKMAKLQKSTLDPAKVSGRCGRLRCCLRYEHDSYESLERKLPRVGKQVGTEFGPATVVDRQILTQLVVVRTDNNRIITIPVEEIQPADAVVPGRAPPPPAKPDEPRPADSTPQNRGRPAPPERREDSKPPAKTEHPSRERPKPTEKEQSAANAEAHRAAPLDREDGPAGDDTKPQEPGSQFVADKTENADIAKKPPRSGRRRRGRRRRKSGHDKPRPE